MLRAMLFMSLGYLLFGEPTLPTDVQLRQAADVFPASEVTVPLQAPSVKLPLEVQLPKESEAKTWWSRWFRRGEPKKIVPTPPKIEQKEEDSNVALKVRSIQYLASLEISQYPELVDTLLASLDDPNEKVRLEALRTIDAKLFSKPNPIMVTSAHLAANSSATSADTLPLDVVSKATDRLISHLLEVDENGNLRESSETIRRESLARLENWLEPAKVHPMPTTTKEAPLLAHEEASPATLASDGIKTSTSGTEKSTEHSRKWRLSWPVWRGSTDRTTSAKPLSPVHAEFRPKEEFTRLAEESATPRSPLKETAEKRTKKAEPTSPAAPEAAKEDAKNDGAPSTKRTWKSRFFRTASQQDK